MELKTLGKRRDCSRRSQLHKDAGCPVNSGTTSVPSCLFLFQSVFLKIFLYVIYVTITGVSVSGLPPSGGVYWLGEGAATLVACVQYVCILSVEESGPGAGSSAVAVVSHEGHDAGRRPRQLEEGVLEQLLGCGSL